IQEVLEHINYEEQVVFPYIKRMLLGTSSQEAPSREKEYGIEDFEQRHNNIEEKLSDLKNLLVKYFPCGSDRYLRMRILNELFDLEQDLTNHARLEDKVLIPVVKTLEQQNSSPS
ncbi:MAG: hemerythrin domain-containing protein, partial [Bacteroidales bacterium]